MEYVKPADTELQHPIDGVTLCPLAASENMSINTGRIEPEVKVPEHSHHHEQLIYMVEGELTMIVDDEEYTVGPGETIAFESNEPHAAENRGDETTLAVDVFMPPRHQAEWE